MLIPAGLAGETLWEQTIHDLVVECAHEAMNLYQKHGVYKWLDFKIMPEPEDKDKILEEIKQKWIKVLDYIQSEAGKRGKKFIVGDNVGSNNIRSSDQSILINSQSVLGDGRKISPDLT